MDIQQAQQDAYNVGVLAGQTSEQQDVYTWHALYGEDNSISEFDRPEGRGFAEVEGVCVKTLLLTPLAGVGTVHRIDIPMGARPIFFRRRSIEIGALQGDVQRRTTTHCIGWKDDEQEVYLFVFDDGSSFLSNDLQAV